jgi:hypothetical protein
MNYNMNKSSLFVVIILFIFAFNWFMQNNGYIGLINEDILIYMNGSLQGFSSLRSFVVYLLIYLLFMNLRTTKEETIFIIRSGGRKKLFNERTFSIFFSSILFATCFSLVNLLMTLLFIGNQRMILDNFYFITLLNWLGMVLFYWWIGMLEKTIEDKINSMNIAIIVTFILIALSYFIKMPLWLPIKDMHIYESVLTKRWSMLDVFLVYVRQFGLVIVFYLIGNLVFSEKDFIYHEK